MEMERELEGFQATFQAIRDEIGKEMVGYGEVVEALLTAMLCGGNVLFESVPGLGKTTLVRTLAAVLELKFSRIQFTPDLMPGDITGTHIITEDDAGRRGFAFRHGPLFANVVLADEINRATPKTQSALLEAMQEHTVTVAGEHFILDEPFFVLATQNPIEMEGTYPLPEAQLDRFFFKLNLPFPNENELREILDRTTRSAPPVLKPVADQVRIRTLMRLVRTVLVAEHLERYIARLVLATHPEHPGAPELTKKYVRFGASPRAGQALTLAAKVRALLDRRAHVAAEDIRPYVLPALRHRIILNFAGESEGIGAEAIIAKVFETVAVPESAGGG